MTFHAGDRVQIATIDDDTEDPGTVLSVDGNDVEVCWDDDDDDDTLYRPRQLRLIGESLSERLARFAAQPERERRNPVAGTFAAGVRDVLEQVRHTLVTKNEAYGNSALDPVRIFSTGDASEGIRTRIDDKLSRIARGADAGEDTVLDLIGYLVMLRISEKDNT